MHAVSFAVLSPLTSSLAVLMRTALKIMVCAAGSWCRLSVKTLQVCLVQDGLVQRVLLGNARASS